MIVVEVGVKTKCKIYGCRSTLKKHQNNVNIEYTRVKLGAKQLSIFKIDWKTTQYFWIQSLI
jgi:hypothetical protein